MRTTPIPESHAEQVCLESQGADECVFLGGVHQKRICLKHTGNDDAVLSKLEQKEAKGDNCTGAPDFFPHIGHLKLEKPVKIEEEIAEAEKIIEKKEEPKFPKSDKINHKEVKSEIKPEVKAAEQAKPAEPAKVEEVKAEKKADVPPAKG